MRIKLDENMPTAAKVAAEALGHDVDTVIDEGLQGAPGASRTPSSTET